MVIGSEGFIGSSLCLFLKNKGERVIHFDLKRSALEDARIAKINFDNIDRVYFLAWDVGGAKYLYKNNSQMNQLDWNLGILMNIMPQLEKSKKPFLFVSSQLAEECDTVYGVTKRLGEVWTKLINGVFVRQWNVYGPFENRSDRSHVVADFIYQALTTKTIKMITTGNEKRQFIYIDDVCEAWHKAISDNIKGVYDITSFEWKSVIDVANVIAKLTQSIVVPGQEIGSTPLTPINGKIPGWFPRVSLEDGLKKTIEDFNKRINL